MTASEIIIASSEFWNRIPFSSATWFVIGILIFSTALFVKASKDPNSKVNWEDMIIDSKSNRTSPYKLGFLIGSIVSTWIVIILSDRGTLTYDMFGIYLLYMVSGAGFVEWLKHGKKDQSTEG